MAEGGYSSDTSDLDSGIDQNISNDETKCIRKYFTCEEWQAMVPYEISMLVKVAENYKFLCSIGLPATKPPFMQRNLDGVEDNELEGSTINLDDHAVTASAQIQQKGDDTSVEEADPASSWSQRKDQIRLKSFRGFTSEEIQSRKNMIKNKMRMSVESICRLETSIKSKEDFVVECIRDPCNDECTKKVRPSKIEALCAKRSSKRNMVPVKIPRMEIPKTSKFIFCFECGTVYTGICPLHGGLTFVPDKTTENDGVDLTRAYNTLPVFLDIRKSSIRGAGKGVWTAAAIPKGTCFGPYQGVIVRNQRKASKSGYCWEIFKNGKPSHYIDGRDESVSNWMRFVNSPPNPKQQNLIAFQLHGQIYYTTMVDISPGTELLVWYGDEYSKDCLSQNRQVSTKYKKHSQVGRKSSQLAKYRKKKTHKKNKLNVDETPVITVDSPDLLCHHCNVTYESLLSFHKHMHLVHGQLIPVAALEQLKRPKIKKIKKKRKHGRMMDDHSYCKPSRMTDSESSDVMSNIKPHQCVVCQRVYSRFYDLEVHYRQHSGVTPHQCPICNKLFKTTTQLNMHTTKTHSEPIIFRCSDCDSTFTSGFLLKSHRRIHTDSNVRQCPHCQKVLANPYFKHHVKIHEDRNLYTCLKCNKQLSSPYRLVSHKRLHATSKE